MRTESEHVKSQWFDWHRHVQVSDVVAKCVNYFDYDLLIKVTIYGVTVLKYVIEMTCAHYVIRLIIAKLTQLTRSITCYHQKIIICFIKAGKARQ